MRKAQSLSLNTIIVAALALLVLVILALVFTGRLNIWSQEAKECAKNGYQCKESCDEGQVVMGGYSCPQDATGTQLICCGGVS